MRLFEADGSIVALNDDLSLAVSWFSDEWFPPGGLATLAEDTRNDERSREIPAAEVPALLEALGAPPPSLS